MPSLSIRDVVVGEGDAFVDLEVRMDAAATQTVTVRYATAAATADGSGYDYDNSNGTLTFAAGELSKTIRVPISQYSGVEPIERFFVNLSAPTVATIARASAMVTIIDNDTVRDSPSLFVGDVVVDEKSGSAAFVVRLGLANGEASTGTVMVDYTTADRGASAGADYTARSGTLSFAPGESVKTVLVPISDDTAVEGLERFALTLSNARGATIVQGQGIAEIGASDATATSQPRLSVYDRVVGEGDGWVDLVVSLNQPGQSAVSVNFATAAGTADGSDYDYGNASGTLTFAPGETTQTVRVALSQYSGAEGLEQFVFNLSVPVNAAIDRASAVITIVDNDHVVDTPVIFVNDLFVDEKDGTARFTVRLGQAAGESSNGRVTVNYATADGSALAGSDYTGVSGSLSFASGESVKTVVVDLIDDAAREGLERFSLVLSSPVGATVAHGPAVAEIGASDATATSQPRLRVDDRVIGEGEGYVDVLVSLDQPGQNPVSVAYATQAGTADGSGYDYSNASGTINFASGETTKTVRLEISQYSPREELESFYLRLSSPVNASIERSLATLTVVDNDSVVDTPRLFVKDVVVDEKAGTANFVVTLGQRYGESSNGVVSVSYATVAGTALAGSDFIARSGSLVFAPGESVKTVAVDLIDDTLAEAFERFSLVLSNASGATLADGNAAAEIGANDATATALPRLSVADIVVGEGDGYVDLVVSLSQPGQSPVTVTFGSAAGSADGSGYDFVNTSGSLVFPVGQTTQTLRLQLSEYSAAEPLESFRINLSSPVNASIARGSAMVTVIDNDAVVDTPTISVRDVVVDEKDGTAAFVVVLGSASAGQSSNSTITVDYTTAAGTAYAGADFVPIAGTLRFAPGESVKTVVVDLVDDALAEGIERLHLRLSNAAGATIADGRAVAEIGASDQRTASQPAITSRALTVSEGDGTFDVVVSLSAPSSNAVSVNYATRDGTATGSGYDYHGVSGTLNFAPGETSKAVRIELSGYQAEESSETVRLQLTAPVNASVGSANLDIVILDDDTSNGTVVLSGGRGDDLYRPAGTTDRIVESADGGIDTVIYGGSYTLPDALENLLLTGSAPASAVGNAGHNVLRGNAANNTLDGLGGIDTALVSGVSSASSVVGGVASRTVSNATDGSDTLLSIERLQFSDVVLASDTTVGGHTYGAYAMLNAAFDFAPPSSLLSQWTAQLDQLGGNLRDLAQSIINFYAPGVPNEVLVAYLWGTIVESPIPAAELATFVGLIENGTFTQASLLEFVSQFPLNTAEIVQIVGSTLPLDPGYFPPPG